MPHEIGNEKQFLPTRPSCKMLSCKSRSGMRTDDIFLKRPIYFYLGNTRNATSRRCIFLRCKPRASAGIGISERCEPSPEILRGISTTIWDSVVHVGQGSRHCWAFAERDTRVSTFNVHFACIQCHNRFQPTDNARQLLLEYFRLQTCLFIEEIAYDALTYLFNVYSSKFLLAALANWNCIAQFFPAFVLIGNINACRNERKLHKMTIQLWVI